MSPVRRTASSTDQLALEVRRDGGGVPGPLGDLLEQPAKAEHSSAEDRAALGELALSVLDIAEGGHHQNRLILEAGPEAAQHGARLGGVGRTGDEL